MTTIRPFTKQGNFTVVNNFVIDHIMPDVSPNAFKVLMFAIRKTVGWHKEADRISYSQFREGCGIKSDHTISRALSELLDLGYLTRWQVGTHKRTKKPLYSYGLNTDYEIELNTVENAVCENSNTVENAVSNTVENAVSNTVENAETKHREKKQTYMMNDDIDHDVLEVLTSFGIDQTMAMRLSKICSVTLAQAWIEYANDKGEALRNPQGFVVSKLKVGVMPRKKNGKGKEFLLCPTCYQIKHKTLFCEDCGKCYDCCECESAADSCV
jgi:hypothetical protein